MATYADLQRQAGASGMSLAELFRRAKEKRAARGGSDNPGAAPTDAAGTQRTVSIPGEAPIQAQPVAGQRQVDVTIGTPTVQQLPDRTYQMAPMQFQAGAPQQQPVNPQANMDPRAAQLRALMGQYMQSGMSQQQAFQTAMRRMQAGG